MYLTWFDSNTWLIELGSKRILLDPWLVGSLTFGNLEWLFKGDRPTPLAIPENVDLILLSQGLPDHAHPPTLEKLDRQIPVVGSPAAAKVVEALGYTQVTGLLHGEVYRLGDHVTIQATPGSLTGPNTVENGYLLKDHDQKQTLYYEPHGSHPEMLKDLAPIDVVITPLFDLSLPLIGPIIRGSKAAVQVAEWTHPQVLVATTNPGNAHYEGILLFLLKATGGSTTVEQELSRLKLKTKVMDPVSGERFTLDLKDLNTSQASTL